MPTGCMCWNMRGSYGKVIPAVLPRRLARVISEFKYGRPIADLWSDPHFIMPVTTCQYSQTRGNSRRDRVRSGMREFESSRPSQAVQCIEILPLTMTEMPANGGILRFNRRSPYSKCGHFRLESADSLRRVVERFPFS